MSTSVARICKTAPQGLLLAGLVAVVPLWYLGAAPFTHTSWFVTVQPGFPLLAGMLLAVCAFAADPWAGLLVGYFLVSALWRNQLYGMEMAMNATIGLGVLLAARRIGPPWRTVVRWVVLFVGAVQVVIVINFNLGAAGFSWGPWAGGSLGNPNYVAAFLAIASAWAPWWLLPFYAAGILATKAFLGALGLVAVIVIRWPRVRPAILAAVAVLLGTWLYRGGGLVSWHFRAAMWSFAVWHWWGVNPVFGLGPGGWYRALPQIKEGELPWAQAHNEFLQLGFEGGLVALLVLAGWVFSHRWVLKRAATLSVFAAITIESLAMFPFHVASLAVLSLTALGFATTPEVEDAECD